MKTYSLRSVPVRSLLKWAGLAASSFYYKRSGRPKGIRPSTHSVNEQGELMENKVVVLQIEKVLRQEFCCYGYKNMTAELRGMGWIINHKKVYRLMKESKLLYGARIRPMPFKRDFIRFRSLKPERPLQYLSMDYQVRVCSWDGQKCAPIDGYRHLQQKSTDLPVAEPYQKRGCTVDVVIDVARIQSRRHVDQK